MATVTSTESFAARAQRSEARRVAIWTAVLLALLGATVLRRALGGAVMSVAALFWPTMAVLALALGGQAALWLVLQRANRSGILLRPLVWKLVAMSDLCVPIALLSILAWQSPRGAVPALSAPGLLILALVVLLSVLRLQPLFTLGIGLAAAAFHAILTVRAILVTNAAANLYPVYFSYTLLLALTAIAGMLVAREIKRHLVEAVAEATAREQAEQRVATMQRDLTIARDIQKGLMPAGPPDFDGFELAGMSRPAELTGGDYYDWQILPDGRLIVVLADVTGHGIGPALVMAVCRAYARASAGIVGVPGPMMRRLNDLLHADLPADRFITLVIAMIDREGNVQLLSAGHGPTLLYQAATGRIRQFGGDGLPLGVSTAEQYDPPAFFKMEQDDVLVLLTDGFHEWRREADGASVGIERLEKALVTQAKRKAQGILEGLDLTARAFVCGSTQQDDVTAVVIKRTKRSRGISLMSPLSPLSAQADRK